MDYILLHKSFGAVSMSMVQDRMTEEIILVAKTNTGYWQIKEKDGEWMALTSVMKILENKFSNVINWGNHVFSQNNYFKVNKPAGISLASDKAQSRMFLQESGIKVPKTYMETNLNFYEKLKYPLIVRPSHHHGGKDFNVFQNYKELEPFLWGKVFPHWYVSEVFEKTTEYRVHCGHGRVLIVQEKPLVPGELRANQAVNHESWKVLKWGEINQKIALESLKAVKVLGLDYGAVDIMYNSTDGSFAICEVNTSPSINTDYSSGKYAKYFSWIIRNNFPKHFSLIEGFGKNGYIFDNDMLEETF